MDVDAVESPPTGVEADALALAVAEPVQLSPVAQEVDRALGGRLGRLAADGALRGRRRAVTTIHADGELAARMVIVAGLGPREDVDADALRTAAAKAARHARDAGARSLAWACEEAPLSAAEQGRAVADGVLLGPYEPGRWKTAPGEHELERLVLAGPEAVAALDEARRAAVVADWTNRCRRLVDAPANELTPQALADFAEELAGRLEHLRFEALGPEEIRSAGMGALLSVAQGSHNEPRLITLAYEPPEPARPDVLLGLVGKAITFDSGGLSLKPAARMSDMKADMGGGGAVLAGTAAIAELGIPLRVLTVAAACENMAGGHASRPGDIVTAANGKTIEITNTDAEGRLVLADALWHAREAGATHLLDLATLTGGIVTALGDVYAGLFGNDDGWVAEIRAAGEASGDHAWPMPLHDSYARYFESVYADLKNSSELKQGTPTYAARFLAEFAGEGPWAHLDIAGTAHIERSRGDYYAGEGATGYGVRLLAELARALTW